MDLLNRTAPELTDGATRAVAAADLARPWRAAAALVANPWTLALSLTLVLGLLFQGSRGIWEPDEGFYTNVTFGMVKSGDWWIPRLNGTPFLDKPPLNYWAMAASVRVFGADEWALRLPHAIWFAGTSLIVGLLAGRFWGSRYGPRTMLIYATMLCPFLAANVVTPDTPLTFWVALAAYAYWRWGEAEQRVQVRWIAVGALAMAAGFLTKGPAMLVFLLPLGLHALLIHRRRSLVWILPGALAAAAGVSWYASLSASLPGAAEYFLDSQVVGRLVESHYQRNAGWRGALSVYPSTILAGTLPWLLVRLSLVLRRARQKLEKLLRTPREHPTGLFLFLWIAAPLAVLSLASSRLPLYALPAFPALALSLSRLSTRSARPAVKRRRAALLLCASALPLLSLKAVSAVLPNHRNTSAVADGLRAIGSRPDEKIVVVDEKRNGLAAYGFQNVEWARQWNRPYPYFSPPGGLTEELQELISRRSAEFLVISDPSRRDVLTELLDATPDLACKPVPVAFSVAFSCRIRTLPNRAHQLPTAG